MGSWGTCVRRYVRDNSWLEVSLQFFELRPDGLKQVLYRMFDHYAHLGGAMFGVGYHMYGAGWWDRLRMRTMPPQRKKEEEEEAEKTQ